jgi:hypothetical protein
LAAETVGQAITAAVSTPRTRYFIDISERSHRSVVSAVDHQH